MIAQEKEMVGIITKPRNSSQTSNYNINTPFPQSIGSAVICYEKSIFCVENYTKITFVTKKKVFIDVKE